MDEFTERLHALPKELFDEIENLVFDSDYSDTQVILDGEDGHQPPAALQVSRATRRRFATVYYSTATFTFTDDNFALLTDFLYSLPRAHCQLIRKIHNARDVSIMPALPHSSTDILLRGQVSFILSECADGRIDPEATFSMDVLVKNRGKRTEKRVVERKFDKWGWYD